MGTLLGEKKIRKKKPSLFPNQILFNFLSVYSTAENVSPRLWIVELLLSLCQHKKGYAAWRAQKWAKHR